ncbi:MAG: 23S rRNA (adenine(2503)-C(2))-methyltransferase RlmN [Campylobacter sp.]|nr:23S rRNA (adenine(2503)-C(2))-methyltransferase RlmN [Campylobacter sp.]
MKNFFNLTKKELEELVSPKFRATQIFDWVYKKYATDFLQMSNLPKDLQENLSNLLFLDPLKEIKKEISKDGSIKYLFELKDKNTIETVLLPMKEEINENGKTVSHARYTICVSSQVGCRMGCAFCLTGKSGLIRNLEPGEIIAQVWHLKKDNSIPYERRVNIVYMGMGEPLDNFENLTKAIEIFKENDGLCIGARRQTVSTSGLASQIKKLGQKDLGVLLAISLHAVNDELRVKLMPINRAYNIKAVMDAVKEFPIDMRKRVMFEYLVMDGLNDSLKDAKTLVKLLHGIKAKVNLIYFNPHSGSEFGRPSEEKMVEFRNFLQAHGVTCTIRQSKGLDISAACGQLKNKEENASS